MSVINLNFHLERFEGPLGLLLHLIREEEMNIFDIDIAKITAQYLSYIKNLKSIDLENAGDFVAMAATLLQIKSRMLLPRHEGEGEEVIEEDPRKQLVQRLIEYQKFQDAAKMMGDRPWIGRDLWVRGERLDLKAPANDDIEVEENPLFSLISAYRLVIKSMRKGVHKVVGAMQSISSRILELKDHLIVGQKVSFNELIKVEAEARPTQILVTFLSLLELAKMGFVTLFQSENFSNIHVEAKKVIDRDILSQVENYENVQAEKVAEQILANSIDELVENEQEVIEEEASAATDEEINAAMADLGDEMEIIETENVEPEQIAVQTQAPEQIEIQALEPQAKSPQAPEGNIV